jgi:hypothetical protein
VTGPNTTWSDETMLHGMQKVRGSNSELIKALTGVAFPIVLVYVVLLVRVCARPRAAVAGRPGRLGSADPAISLSALTISASFYHF